jgi:hypothetical protein
MIRLAEFQRAIVNETRDRIACAMAEQTGKKTVAACRAYRASAAGTVMVVVPNKAYAMKFAERMLEIYDDISVTKSINGVKVATPYGRIVVRTYDILKDHWDDLFLAWGVCEFQEVIFLEHGTQVFENPNMPRLRRSFDPLLDSRQLQEFIEQLIDGQRVQVITIIATPIPSDPIFQFCSMAPQRWGMYSVKLLDAWWAAKSYADKKVDMLRSEDPNKFALIAARLEAKWKGENQ